MARGGKRKKRRGEGEGVGGVRGRTKKKEAMLR